MRHEYGLEGIAFVAGIVVWGLISALSGQREAWDSDWYMTVGMPVLALLAAIFGYVEPKRSWKWGVLLVVGQAAWMFGTQGFGNLWPLGLVAFGIFALPLVLTARLGAAISKRWNHR